MIKKLLVLMLFASCAFAQLPNMGLRTWARGVNPGAGSLSANSDSLNGNWFKIDSLWGVDHKGGFHFNPDIIGIARFVDDSTIKVRWRNDDTIITKSTGQYALITQVRDDGTRTASALNALLVRTSDDDSTLSGIQASGNGVTAIYGTLGASSLVRDTNSFTGSVTSDTVVITGATAKDIYVVTPLAASANALPVAGDLLNWFPKADTLIVNRAAGTTAGLTYSYIRIQ